MLWDAASWSLIWRVWSNSTKPVKIALIGSVSIASCTRAGSRVPKSVAPTAQRRTCLSGEAGPFPAVEGGAVLPQAAISIATRQRSVGKSITVNFLLDRIGDFSFVYEELP